MYGSRADFHMPGTFPFFSQSFMRCSRDAREERFAGCRPSLQPLEFEGAASLIWVSTLLPEIIVILTVLTFQLSSSSLDSTLRPAAMTSLFLIAGWILTFEPAVVHSAVQVGVYNLRYVRLNLLDSWNFGRKRLQFKTCNRKLPELM
jgi:hypothetical protein